MKDFILLLLLTISLSLSSQSIEREIHFGMGAVGIDGVENNNTAYEYRLGGTVTYPDIIMDIELTNVRFSIAADNFYYSGSMYLGKNLLPGLFIGVGPTFIAANDRGTFGMSAKLNLDFWENSNYRIFTQAGLHYSGAFLIWSGTLNVAYQL